MEIIWIFKVARLAKLGWFNVVVNRLYPFFAVVLFFDGFDSAARPFVENLNIDGRALNSAWIN